MRKLLFYLVPVIFLFVLSNCKVPEISTDPTSKGEKYKSVRIRVKAITDQGKEKTKVILGFNNKGDRLIFLGPMNQVLFEILVQGNYSKVIVPKRKQYWSGEFREFLYELWRVDLTYNEIRALLLEQRVNSLKLKKSGFTMQIIESEKKKYPVRINLASDDIKLEFRVYEVKERAGKIVLTKELKGYSRVTLRKMFRSGSE